MIPFTITFGGCWAAALGEAIFSSMLADCFRPPWFLLLLPLRTGTGLIIMELLLDPAPFEDGEMARVAVGLAELLLKQLPVFARLRFSKFDAAMTFLLETPVLN